MVEIGHLNNNNSLFQINKYFNILTGPRIASASLGGPVHQDLIKHFFVNKQIFFLNCIQKNSTENFLQYHTNINYIKNKF